jgi:hypothetical protein
MKKLGGRENANPQMVHCLAMIGRDTDSKVISKYIQGDLISFLRKIRGDTQRDGQTQKNTQTHCKVIFHVSLILFSQNKESWLKMYVKRGCGVSLTGSV